MLEEQKNIAATSALAFAPAKLNLGLRVVGRRADGYHLLDMLNVQVDLCDQLELSLSRSRAVASTVTVIDETDLGLSAAQRIELENGSKNIAARAVVEVLRELQLERSFNLVLRKRIPLGGGLGGGSSDAACALKLAMSILQREGGLAPLSQTSLLKLALRLGADVPYFLSGGAARVRGIGEQVEPVSLAWVERYEAVIILPSFGIATEEVYRLVRADIKIGESSQLISDDQILEDAKFVNHLEPYAVRIRPELGRLLSALRLGCGPYPQVRVGMTGSGSVCYVLLPKQLRGALTPAIEKIAQEHSATVKFAGLRLQPG